jgi:hypothetical protein
MLENIILVREAIHSSKEWGHKGMVIKIDRTSAFDRVQHGFLFKILTRFGFGPNILAWISSCINDPWISPLINGRPTNFFNISIGLQNDSPSPPFSTI